MKPLWRKIVSQTILRHSKSEIENSKPYSNYQFAKGFRELKIMVTSHFKDLILITAGIFSASFGFKGFLLTNRFIDGGATGISLLISAVTSIPLYVLIICVNIPFIILGYNILGKAFAIKTVFAISVLALCLATINFPDVTKATKKCYQ